MRQPIPDDVASRVRELAAGVPCPACGPSARISLSQRAIAAIVGVSKTTVANVLHCKPRKPKRTKPPELAPRKTGDHRCPGCGRKIDIDQCVACAAEQSLFTGLRVYA